jgi:hypothetical protein
VAFGVSGSPVACHLTRGPTPAAERVQRESTATGPDAGGQHDTPQDGTPVTEKYEFINAEHAAAATEMAPAPTVSQMCGG